MKKIPLTQGAHALVDDSDFEWLSQWKWRLHSMGYACRSECKPKRRDVLMHRLILDAPDGMEVDHENRDGLDNQRSNLRLATIQQNHANQRPRFGRRYKGAYPEKRKGGKIVWSATITIDGKARRLGTFKTEEAAARTYDKAAREAFGEFALLNFCDLDVPGAMR